MTFDKAIATMRLRQLASEEESLALTVLLEESLRYKKALAFYAKRDNYLDGVPMIKDPETGMMDNDDEGAMARAALRLTDIAYAPVVRGGDENVSA